MTWQTGHDPESWCDPARSFSTWDGECPTQEHSCASFASTSRRWTSGRKTCEIEDATKRRKTADDMQRPARIRALRPRGSTRRMHHSTVDPCILFHPIRKIKANRLASEGAQGAWPN